MFNKLDTSKKDEFLGKAKALRELRSTEKQKDDAAIKIQALVRRFLTRCRLLHQMHEEVDKFLQIPADRNTEYKPQMKPSIDVFKLTQKFLIFFKEKEDRTRFECLCKYILLSMNAESMKHVYVSVMLSKNHTLLWIQQLKAVLWKCCLYFKSLKPEIGEDMKTITVCLSMLVTFTSCTNWKVLKGKMGDSLKVGMMQLCNNVMGDLNSKGLYRMLQTLLVNGLARSKPSFKAATLAAIVTMSLRPLMASNFSDKLMTMFILHILSVPGLIHHLSIMSHESVVLMMTHRVFSKVIELLYQDQSARIIFNVLEGNYALCLLANLIHLGGSEMEGLVENTNNFMMVMTKLLESCKIYVMNKKSNLTHWHPVLGWFSQKGDQNLHDAMPYVVLQLQQLWSLKMIRLLFEQLFVYNDMLLVYDMQKCSSQPSPSKNIFKKAIEKASQKSSNAKVKLDSPVLQSTCLACKMYLIAMNTLTQLKLDIVAGLCFQDVVLPRLWKLITDLGSHSGLKAFMDILTAQPNSTEHMVFSLLQLGCETATHSITILDDMELYEQGKPFSLDNLVAISYFLNQFYFKVIWNGLMDVKAAGKDPTMGAVLGLLTVLYERDCRRAYAPDDHWLTRDVKPSVLIAELERGKKQAQFLLLKVPHIIPHKERVILFRKMVAKEKDVLGLTESACVSPQSTLISVHRGRIVEDGYRQLAALPVNALKGVIRVKFVNEQGLDEAGIDQDGVFKEFLEETIKHVFDPSLNLFRVTDEQKLYPSPTSYMQDSHLSLFEFVGRMLGKAVYEGIVVEVPFASFFLSQMLSQQHNKTYSSLDELPSLDPDLYKSLTYVKHYEGDVSDLDLTFSYDEDVMGKIVNHELRPGGKAIPVTNDNKISYIHLMAHFKMRVQIKEQTKAFIHGFKSVVNHEWLSMFSPPELQKLISGDTADLDMEDLRRHTQYYGGFHGNHRVVCWLWDILEKDFTPAERGLFLKFVTSCSKPPLLGFAHLEPPFSIRCVEVSDEQDTGDTVGSVLKGFFNIRKRDPVGRLPTSSTCFNLLKLPNYQKKSTLREKLRYAITSHTGFELS